MVQANHRSVFLNFRKVSMAVYVESVLSKPICDVSQVPR